MVERSVYGEPQDDLVDRPSLRVKERQAQAVVGLPVDTGGEVDAQAER